MLPDAMRLLERGIYFVGTNLLRQKDEYAFSEGAWDTLPTCNADWDGARARTPGGAGVADTYWRCTKSAADAYAWREVDTAGGGYTDENARDALATALVAGNNIDITVDDPNDTITVAVETLTLADVSDVTASASEVNVLDGIPATLTATELGYVDGVTSALQTQLNAKADDSAVVHDTGDETVAGVKTFTSDPIIPDEAYGVGWNGVLEPPTKNAVYDKIEAVVAGGATEFADNVFRIQDDGDATKEIAFQASGITTGTVRTLTVPDADLTIVGTATTQTLTNKTLTAPTIADFTNAAHDHGDADDGGQLTDAALSSAVGLAKGGTGQALVDPGADRGLFWDDSESKVDWLTFDSTDFAISTTTLALGSAPSFTDFTNAGHDHTDADDGGQLTDAALSAAVGIAKGGTGQTSQTAAFDALSPLTTQGDVMYHNGTDNVRLGPGTSGQLLTTGGAAANPSWASQTKAVNITIGDGTNEIPDGVWCDFDMPVAGTFIRWRLMATKFTSGSTGSITLDIWGEDFASFPPTVADSISTSKPTISGAASAEDSSITDWTPEAFAAGDTFRINVDSCTTISLCTLSLWFTVP